VNSSEIESGLEKCLKTHKENNITDEHEAVNLQLTESAFSPLLNNPVDYLVDSVRVTCSLNQQQPEEPLSVELEETFTGEQSNSPK